MKIYIDKAKFNENTIILFSVCSKEQAASELRTLTGIPRSIFKQLKLPSANKKLTYFRVGRDNFSKYKLSSYFKEKKEHEVGNCSGRNYGIKLGDILFFSWEWPTDNKRPEHLTVVTEIDAEGYPIKGFGAWNYADDKYDEKVPKFREITLDKYEGLPRNILNYVVGVVTPPFANNWRSHVNNWNDLSVAKNWDGYEGAVCVDGITFSAAYASNGNIENLKKIEDDGYGGTELRKDMEAVYINNPNAYKPINIASKGYVDADPKKGNLFYRRNPWLMNYFQSKGLWREFIVRK